MNQCVGDMAEILLFGHCSLSLTEEEINARKNTLAPYKTRTGMDLIIDSHLYSDMDWSMGSDKI